MNTSEDQLIQQIATGVRGRRSPGLRLGIGDDAALLAPTPGAETVLSCDWFVEGNHFLKDKHPPQSVGWKCLARALSDIAAMGAHPRCFLLSLALPDDLSRRWLSEFLSGLRKVSQEYRCPLVGGDTTRKREISINVTVMGEVQADRAVRRSGAKPGDVIFVSGRLGEAEMGLRKLRGLRGPVPQAESSLRKHLYPQPRLTVGQWLAKSHLVSAMMDISDGLSSDLPRLCAASGVGAYIEAAKLPLPVRLIDPPKGARGLMAGTVLDLALDGGDDYELLFTVPRRRVAQVPARIGTVPLTRIGEVTGSRRIRLVSLGHDTPLVARGWDPFRRPGK